MTVPVELHPKAVEEARAIRLWYFEQSRLAASVFVVELDKAIELIGQNPMTWLPYVHGTRRYLMRRFPFSVVYVEVGDRVQIIAIAHARRRPGYWHPR